MEYICLITHEALCWSCPDLSTPSIHSLYLCIVHTQWIVLAAIFIFICIAYTRESRIKLGYLPFYSLHYCIKAHFLWELLKKHHRVQPLIMFVHDKMFILITWKEYFVQFVVLVDRERKQVQTKVNVMDMEDVVWKVCLQILRYCYNFITKAYWYYKTILEIELLLYSTLHSSQTRQVNLIWKYYYPYLW